MSAPNSLSMTDIRNWAKNLLIFASPMVAIYLVAVIAAVQASGFSLSDFVPSNIVLGAMALYALNAILDIFRKFSGDTTPPQPQPQPEPPVTP